MWKFLFPPTCPKGKRNCEISARSALYFSCGAIVENGYNKIAEKYTAQRARFGNGKGSARFMGVLPKNASVPDAGCGAGVPIAKTLMRGGETHFWVPARNLTAKTHSGKSRSKTQT
ncbi:hypothetical protein AUJ17_01135 [Candidatus Micrarchaeota archaeon CG1_02_47_40]|nr:MAG: hypothetical protein AUJ17_01135 [Candidatus Micrarchaeota archaeon CG1_02_47_40]